MPLSFRSLYLIFSKGLTMFCGMPTWYCIDVLLATAVSLEAHICTASWEKAKAVHAYAMRQHLWDNEIIIGYRFGLVSWRFRCKTALQDRMKKGHTWCCVCVLACVPISAENLWHASDASFFWLHSVLPIHVPRKKKKLNWATSGTFQRASDI